MKPKGRVVLCGYFLGAGEVRKKRVFLQELAERCRKNNVDLVLIENSNINKSDIIGIQNIINCPEYGFKLRKLRLRNKFRLLKRIHLSHFGRINEVTKKSLPDLLMAEEAFAGGNSGLRLVTRLAIHLYVLTMMAFVRSLRIRASDTIITWGDLATLHGLLRGFGRAAGAKLVVAEYGELQNCFFLSERGLFQDAWPAKRFGILDSLCPSPESIRVAAEWRMRVIQNKISNKKHTSNKNNLQEWIAGRKVIVFPGLVPLGSGLVPRNTQRSIAVSPVFESNADLLMHLERIAKKHDACVLYKDHPNTFHYYPRYLVSGKTSKTVTCLGDVDIHEVFDLADVVVSLGSKSVFIALMKGLPVVLTGPFTLSEYGFTLDCQKLENLETCVVNALANGKRTMFEDVDIFHAKLMEYWLFGLENKCFPRGPVEAVNCLMDYIAGNRKQVSIETQNFIGN